MYWHYESTKATTRRCNDGDESQVEDSDDSTTQRRRRLVGGDDDKQALADKVARREHRQVVRAERCHRRRCEIAADTLFPRVEGYRIRYEPRRNGPTWLDSREQVIVRGRGRSKTFSFCCSWESSENTFCSLLQDAGVRAAEWVPPRCNRKNSAVMKRSAPVMI